jgi:hypothetical protein
MFQLSSATISMDHRQLCGSRGTDKTCAFLRLVAELSDLFLGQRIYIKFCVKLGNNASDTCAMLSKSYGGEAMRKSSVSEW